jgi:hypothetical protein
MNCINLAEACLNFENAYQTGMTGFRGMNPSPGTARDGAQLPELGDAERPVLGSPPGPTYARRGSRAAVGRLTRSTAALGGKRAVCFRAVGERSRDSSSEILRAGGILADNTNSEDGHRRCFS